LSDTHGAAGVVGFDVRKDSVYLLRKVCLCKAGQRKNAEQTTAKSRY
jgi:hypothetical protein